MPPTVKPLVLEPAAAVDAGPQSPKTDKGWQAYLSNVRHASGVAPLRSSGFKCAEHASTDTTKPRVRRDIVEGDLPRVGDGTHREDYPVLDGNKQRIVWLIKPRHEEFRGFVPEPPLQNVTKGRLAMRYVRARPIASRPGFAPPIDIARLGKAGFFGKTKPASPANRLFHVKTLRAERKSA